MSGGLLSVFLVINILFVGAAIALAVEHARARGHEEAPQERKQEKKTFAILPHDARQRILEEAEEDYQAALKRSAKELEASLDATTRALNQEIDKIGGGIMTDEMRRYKQELHELRLATTSTIGAAQSEIHKHQEELRQRLANRQAEIDAKLNEQQAELEAKLAARTSEIEADFREKQAEYTRKQAEMEAKLAQHQTELEATLKERETVIAQHQADLNAEFLERQKEHAKQLAAMEDKLTQEMEVRRLTLASQLDAKLGDLVAAFLTESLRHNVDLGAQLPYLLAQLEEHKEEIKQELTA